jgi:hypothetical protein
MGGVKEGGEAGEVLNRSYIHIMENSPKPEIEAKYAS